MVTKSVMQAVLPSRLREDSAEGLEPTAPGPPSLAELFTENAPFVFRVLRRLGVGESDVDDVCQEVFLAVHKGLPRFEGRARARTWIYAIAVRVAANHARRAFRRRERVTEHPPEHASEFDAETSLDQRRTRALLDSLLEALDPDKREVFVLFELEELNMREVAEIVGCPLPTAYGRLYAARRELQRAAAARGVTP